MLDKDTQDFIRRVKQAESDKRKHFIVKSCIPERLREVTFESYANYKKNDLEEHIYVSRMKALKFIYKYCKNMKEEDNSFSKKSVIISGKSGSGKSSLGSLILRVYIEYFGKSVLYVSYPTFKNQASRLFLGPENQSFLETYLEPDYLMLDEMNETEVNNRFISSFEEVLRSRTDMKKPTIITTKMDFFAIKKYFLDNIYGHITNPYYFHEKIEIESPVAEYNIAEDAKTFFGEKEPRFDVEMLESKIRSFKKAKTIDANIILKILKECAIKNKKWRNQ